MSKHDKDKERKPFSKSHFSDEPEVTDPPEAWMDPEPEPLDPEPAVLPPVPDDQPRLVQLRYHGVLGPDGTRTINRPIPHTREAARQHDPTNAVTIGEDRLGCFTEEEAAYLVEMAPEAFTRVDTENPMSPEDSEGD